MNYDKYKVFINLSNSFKCIHVDIQFTLADRVQIVALCVCTCICLCMFMSVNVRVFMCVCVRVCAGACVCVYTCILYYVRTMVHHLTSPKKANSCLLYCCKYTASGTGHLTEYVCMCVVCV